MPRRSSVFGIPDAIRAELDRRIASAGFGGYAEHAEWLAAQGCAIGLSALKLYGKRLKERAESDSARAQDAAAAAIARMRHAAEIGSAVHDHAEDPLLMHERAAELCMAKLYEITATEEVDAKTLQAISRSLASTIRTVKEARGQRSDEERRSELSKAAEESGRRAGLSDHTANAIRAVVETPAEDLEKFLEEQRRKASAGEGDTGTPMDVIRRVRRDVYGLTDE